MAGIASGDATDQTVAVAEGALPVERVSSFKELSSWRVEAEPSKLSELRKAKFRPPPIEFPPEEFSFVLVGYTRELRVVDMDMLFRLEAPGADRSLVSFEFIF